MDPHDRDIQNVISLLCIALKLAALFREIFDSRQAWACILASPRGDTFSGLIIVEAALAAGLIMRLIFKHLEPSLAYQAVLWLSGCIKHRKEMTSGAGRIRMHQLRHAPQKPALSAKQSDEPPIHSSCKWLASYHCLSVPSLSDYVFQVLRTKHYSCRQSPRILGFAGHAKN